MTLVAVWSPDQSLSLWPQSRASLQPLVAIWDLDIIIDLNHSRTMDLDMALNSSLFCMASLPQVAIQITQIILVLGHKHGSRPQASI